MHIYYFRGPDPFNEFRTMISMLISAASQSFLLFSIYVEYDIWFKLSKSTHRIAYEETFKSTGLWKNIAIEIGLNLVSPSIIFEGFSVREYNQDLSYETIYNMNDLLLAFSFFRLYHIIKFMLLFSIFREQRASRICSYNGLDNSLPFLIKCYYKQQPLFSLVLSMSILVTAFGLQLHILESPLSEVSG